MALKFVEPPPQVLDSYLNGLHEMTGVMPPKTGAIHVPVYTRSLDSVARASGIDEETMAGCRFYASYPQPLGTLASEMTNPKDYGNANFRALLDGELAEWGWARIPQIAALPQVRARDYWLNLLSIPTLFVEAFYLRPGDDASDRLAVPIDLLAETPAPAAAQPIAAFLARLRPFAIERAAATAGPLMP
jgi:hypothetical protein